MGRTVWKRIGRVAANVLLAVFLAACVFALVMTLLSKKSSDGAAEIFGYQLRVVTSDSMARCDLTDVSNYEIGSIPVRSMVFVKVMPQEDAAADAWYRDLRVGDVLTFRYVYTSQVTITHRITSIEEKPTGGFLIELEGDNRNSESELMTQTIDTSIPNNPNYVIGRVTGQSFLLGFFISLLQAPIGIILIVIVPCFIIILLEVLKIVGVLTEDKRKREQEEQAKRDGELEALRRRLAELEAREAKTEQVEQVEQIEQVEQPEQPEQIEQVEQTEQTEQIEQTEPVEHTEQVEQSAETEQVERSEPTEQEAEA